MTVGSNLQSFVNPYERAARAEKLAAVTFFLAMAHPEVDAETLAHLPERGWALIATGAGVRPLSTETRRQVVDTYRLRAATADAIDLFACFTGVSS